MKKGMKSKGYAKGGAKMMKAKSGKMMKSKGYAKGGAKMMKAKSGKMMKAMGGKMMKSKGYAKGGAKMMKASKGTATFMKNSGKQAQKASNQAAFSAAAFARALKNRTGDRISTRDVQEAMNQLRNKK